MMSAAFSSGRKRVVVFISGGGSNMVSLAKACQAKDFPAEIACVISDKASAGGLAKARDLGIATLVFERKTYGSKAEHEGAILAALGEIAPDIICLAGYMRLISGDFIAPYEGRIINIHPSLLPLFPGLHTHQRAIDSGMKISGCTVHFVTEGMDEGPTIAQGAVPVLSDDTADTLASRILTVEHQLYPLALKLLAEDKVLMEGGKTIFAADEIKSEHRSLISAS
ncbi:MULTISPECIES: phosphoribosylglycinamide formyltransferase [Agrobacterium]|uniref:Phosphoribosylglycinamide formyltransferase n=1 Tax=Agrobacterium tumefaciens TaxID=358 RepID=A0AAE6B8X2_AGRTU|nr:MULTISPECIES: phosphoribosylglycinamide formyltransferase [Agrobacterium]QCL72824.1 phosphoribosylglycinamide formyltransferase [Agrobacterium tumefaciens]QCL78400.1 phosphoribosylglycinamide formyltransferase [Agrobacterium tumefaciens]CUX51260.1 phosphoribosylglycinamide formyltransferase (GART) (GAR transformylase) (5'-phosphoribosylglycinamide transformylase) [Agrobacterium sp. NCPPB 925]